MSIISKKPTILVVDDTPDNIALLTSILSKEYRVKAANNGHTAISLALKNPPCLILLDVMMPDMDGYEVCRKLKSDPRTKNIPVIFVTALGEMEDEKLGFEIGAVDYITKPISP
jgi:putative two-component system response regulator